MSAAPGWTLGILAGGASSRMGSDKASRPFRGDTLLLHAIRRYAPADVPVLVSVRPGSAAPPPPAEAVTDREPGLGPLAGLAHLLDAAATPWVLAMPVDLPLFPKECGIAMLSRAEGARSDTARPDLVVLTWKERVEPFPALVSRSLAPLLRELLRTGARRADSFHDRVRRECVPIQELFPDRDPESAFLNVNTPADLARAEALVASEDR